MGNIKWILCPVCGSKTRIKTRNDTVLQNFLPYIGHHKLKDLRADMFREFYAKLRTMKNQNTGSPPTEATVYGNHAVICGILTSAMEQGIHYTQMPA